MSTKSGLVKDVEFQDIFYTVKQSKSLIKESEKIHLLKGVSGIFRNGHFSAIMGPSGAGKSSLLNAISGYRTSGVTGEIRLNKTDSCYITQEDHHPSLFTIAELMHIACSLKLKNPKTYPNIITDILTNLNLNHRKDVSSDKLSGGERKRLSIALELVANPTTFFLDEPTSGLDEVTASQCIKLLKSLAQQGRTVVCTIHQPSAAIFGLFDQIFVLAKGQCVYQGEPNALLLFLNSLNLKCPKYHSPADYIIELCDTDHGALIPQLAEITQNGKLVYEPISLKECSSKDNNKLDDFEDLSHHFKKAINIIQTTPKFNRTISYNNSNTILRKMKAFSRNIKGDKNKVSPFKQFLVLLHLMMLKIFRNKIALWIQLIHHVMCGVMFGAIFYKTANKGEQIFAHLKYCVGCILVIVYTQVMVPVLSFPSEVKLVKKEFFNRWYTLTPYYLALTISRLPLQVFFNMIFLTFTYWMAGLPNEIWRFGLFSLVAILTSIIAEGMGLAIGATFCVTNGSAVGPLLIAPLMGLAIYGFDFAGDIPIIMYVLMKFSYIRVGAISLILTVFGFSRQELDCNDIYCHFSNPKVLLRFLQIENVSIWNEFAFLIAFMIFFRVVLFMSLKRRCST